MELNEWGRFCNTIFIKIAIDCNFKKVYILSRGRSGLEISLRRFAMKKLVLIPLMASIITLFFISLAAGEAGFTVKNFAVGTGVQDREIVGTAGAFPASSAVYCFLKATDITADTEVSVVWSHGGAEILKTALQLKSGQRWRTWGNKNLMGLKGDWKVELKAPDGTVVSALNFKAE